MSWERHKQEAHWAAVSVPRDAEHLGRVTREGGLFKLGHMQIICGRFPFLLLGLPRNFSSSLKVIGH